MEERHKCPVCGKYMFEYRNCMDICDVCSWCDDAIQEGSPEYAGGANIMSLNEARKAYREGRQVR